MTKIKLRFPIFLLFIMALVILPLLTLGKFISSDLNYNEEVTDYTMEDIVESELPVVNTTTIINPYLDQSVTIKKDYYDYKGDEEKQIKSITKKDNTYIQNTGIDYVCDKVFDVVAILNGTVISALDDETLGKSVEIKHDNGIISIYQGLSEIKVKKDDVINQGTVIGKSGTNELDKELGNHLHFEIYDKGMPMNPANYLNQEIQLEKGN